jgi:hypothetical protein
MITTLRQSLSARKVLVPLLVTLIFTFVMSATAFAQTNLDSGSYMIGYYTGANAGYPDAQMHILNPGSNGGYGNPNEGTGSIPQQGDLCANIYIFTYDEQMIACCSCKVSPNGMLGFNLDTKIIPNPLTGIVPHAGAIKVVASPGGGAQGALTTPPSGPAAAVTGTSGLACDAGSYYPYVIGQTVTPWQLQSWITHVRPLGTPFGAPYVVTEIPFSGVALSQSEYNKLVQQCYAIEASPAQGGVGSGAGKCVCPAPNPA